MPKPHIPAIQTQYAGHHFRSRLEARWAVFFDACGVKWEYEKEGYDLREHSENIGDFQLGYYLPDFWIPQERAWVEIKGVLPDDHWKLTLPEVQIFNTVHLTAARSGWVFFGLPDIDTPCSCVWNISDDYFPNSPSRAESVVDLLAGTYLSDDLFARAKSARFEFGERG